MATASGTCSVSGHRSFKCLFFMTEFTLSIRNPYASSRKLPVGLLHFTAGFLILNACVENLHFKGPLGLTILYLVFGAADMGFALVAGRLLRQRPGLVSRIRILTAIVFIVYSVQLYGYGQSWFAGFMLLIAIVFLFIYLIERRWGAPFLVRIGEEGVHFPRLFTSQRIAWSELEFVVVRGSLLTLDFQNNRVLQLELSVPLSEVEIIKLNEYCARKVRSGTHNPHA